MILMRVAETRVKELGVMRAGVTSRFEAYDFYKKCGYEFVGEEYISPLTHIPHTHMSKNLAAPELV
jgi:predicted GNAT family N-acyltransferase